MFSRGVMPLGQRKTLEFLDLGIPTVGGIYVVTPNPLYKMRIGEVISYMSLAMSPPTPSLNVESCKVVSVRSSFSENMFYLHNLDSSGYWGLSFILGLLMLHTYMSLSGNNYLTGV